MDKSTKDFLKNTSAVFIQIGLSPNSHFVNNLLELEYGEIGSM